MDGKHNFTKKTKRKIASCSVLVFFIGIIVYISWYDCFTEDGLKTQRLFWSKSYTWNDVDYYTLTSSFDGTLQYTVVMKDGTKASCIGGNISTSNFPNDAYPNEDEDYGRYLTKTFSRLGIELKVKDWDNLEKKLSYDYWIKYAKEIKDLSGAE